QSTRGSNRPRSSARFVRRFGLDPAAPSGREGGVRRAQREAFGFQVLQELARGQELDRERLAALVVGPDEVRGGRRFYLEIGREEALGVVVEAIHGGSLSGYHDFGRSILGARMVD